MPKNITNSVLGHNIADILDVNSIYKSTNPAVGNIAIPNYISAFYSDINANGDHINSVNAIYATGLISGNIEFYKPFDIQYFAEYTGQIPMEYYWINNTRNLGVNGLAVNIGQYRQTAGHSPLFISSGMLSGCIVLCLLVKRSSSNNMLLFLHAGNEGESGLDPDTHRAILLKALANETFRVLNIVPHNNYNNIASAELLSQILLDEIPDIVAGTIIHPSNEELKNICQGIKTIHCLPYDIDNSCCGAGYCLITSDPNTTAISIAGSAYDSYNDFNYIRPQSYCTYFV